MGDSFTIILLQLQQFSAAKLKEAQTPCLAETVSSPPAPLMDCPSKPKPEVAKVIAERAKIAKKLLCGDAR
ncbi:MAG: hypothetical protein K0S36_736 [Nitrosospira multiformis]|jgi:hypothetical protein|nr:hypothetical protein [Nitrosospira multiformis]